MQETKENAKDNQTSAASTETQAAPSAEAAQATAPEKPARTRRPAAKRPHNVGLGEQLVFGKYSVKDVLVEDASLANYILLAPRANIHTFGRRKDKAHYVMQASIVERLVNKLMRGGTGKKVGGIVIRTEGRLQGKKLKLMRTVEDAFEIIHSKTNKNPIQLLVDALQNSAPIEDTTRIRYGGINYNVAVGISASRRLDVALRNIALAALIGSFKSRKQLKEALAEEIMLAASKDPNSYAIKRRVERERIARSAR
ncbi:MAG: 30S ribosomal protein S7 [Candidatus Micrarchaeaceae archaeon]